MQAQRGNILFLILLAIILFVALNYAVNSGMRGGGKNGSEESLKSGAAAIQQYVTLLRNEVQRLRLINGCGLDNLDWRHGVYKRYNNAFTYNGGVAPASPKSGCAVFQAYGGSIAPQIFDKWKDAAYEDYYAPAAGSAFKAGHPAFRWVNRRNELTEANDIAIIVNGLDKDLCAYLINPQNPGLPSDDYDAGTDSNAVSPAPYTNGADVAGNVAANSATTGSDFFGSIINYAPGTYCTLGAIIVPQ